MARSVIVILLAIVCGVCAAIGVHQMAKPPKAAALQTTTVFVAAKSIRRGAVIKDEEVKATQWPSEFLPANIVMERSGIVGSSATAAITADEPFFQAKVAQTRTGGFASNIIPKGKRACTILTKGPSASVAGFVRPGDRVDVLVNTRGIANDQSGGGASVTLVHAVEILAIDDIMDVEASTMKMWIKEGLSSVTLLVSPEQALQLSLGQANGTLSLALRNGDDLALTVTPPVTMKMIRDLQAPPPELPAELAETPAESLPAPSAEDRPPQISSARPATYIRTLRGTQSGQVQVVAHFGH